MTMMEKRTHCIDLTVPHAFTCTICMKKTCCEPVKLLYCVINSTLLKLAYALRLCIKNSQFMDVKCRVPIQIHCLFVLLFLS